MKSTSSDNPTVIATRRGRAWIGKLDTLGYGQLDLTDASMLDGHLPDTEIIRIAASETPMPRTSATVKAVSLAQWDMVVAVAGANAATR